MKSGLPHGQTIPPCAAISGNAGVAPEAGVFGGRNGRNPPLDAVRRQAEVRHVLAVGPHGRNVDTLFCGRVVRTEKGMCHLMFSPQLDTSPATLAAGVACRRRRGSVVYRLGWVDNGPAHVFHLV
ncbi:MAG TPA: hypothetical protein VFH06_03430 [Candidatus Saccharimonadales bacterium]|nr:hypothetical protein [Candidatus Saccharimonadales bacterium]